jgi:hypothetical protein
MNMIDAVSEPKITGEFVPLLGETYYRIGSYDAMPPFFITVVSRSDHWLFLATTGGLTAGRINADHALFPYYTADRIIENADNTGSKTVIHVTRQGATRQWTPFRDRIDSPYAITRALYKNIPGTSVIFEEVNADLGLTFRYAWRTSAAYGIVKTGWLSNQGADSVSVTLTDGLLNVLPASVTAGTQNEFSVLLDAYKRSELDPATGLGMYSLSSRLTDLAEPSEALRANVVWQVGLEARAYLISAAQLGVVRQGRSAQTETDIRGQRGAYFVQSTFTLAPDAERSWHIVAEVDQDAAAVANLNGRLKAGADRLYAAVEDDIRDSSEQLRQIVAGADGLQISGDPLSTEHHFANVLFNVMRGGTFIDGYHISKVDFVAFIDTHDHALLARCADFFTALPETFTTQALKQAADAQPDADLIRLCYSYLPLTFSRRHGDPSRPWNRFSIHLKNADGTPQLNYEGNWRDIFQNWEALAYAYPEFVEGMLSVFLNATTLDGYNPYRITRGGVDWEIPEPGNPWANIGYWSDHQIIYLQKLMEVCERFYPGMLRSLLTRAIFAFADVPYRINPYDQIVQDPYNTIGFDWDAEHAIAARVQQRGTDGKLLPDKHGAILHVTLAEKLLNLLLAKLVNFVPDGGIWMNTQRPEWNDANNALVGKGLSVVTACYLRRYVVFLREVLASTSGELVLTQELHTLFEAVRAVFEAYQGSLDAVSDETRRAMLDALGRAGSAYRWQCYGNGFSGAYAHVSVDRLTAFLDVVQAAVDRTIAANRRDDDLYHAYNTLHLGDGVASIRTLYPMLEGQVAVLSSGVLQPEAAVTLLRQLPVSALYRADQHSYILYPDRDLPGFLKKNTFDAARVNGLKLVQTLIDRGDPRLIVRDASGEYHFGGDLRNARELAALLDELAAQPELAGLVAAESAALHDLFEQVFEHDRFTGRSGSFFAYEGLGSIYWHMVSKLLLAVQENVHRAHQQQSDALPALVDAYYDVRSGLGFNKTPDSYGAFPLDPYSHTPRNQGARQPGMTGMVKEEVLTRIAELGVVIDGGALVFNPVLLRASEFLTAPAEWGFWDANGQPQRLEIPAGALAFTQCRVPVIVQQAAPDQIVVTLRDGSQQTIAGHHLPPALSARLFAHDETIRLITIHTNTVAPDPH